MGDNPLSDTHQSEIDSFITEWMSDHRIPGAAVSIIDSNDLVYAEGFGARSLDRNIPTTEDTLFGIGSCTKSFTAAAIMQLTETGELSISDPVDEYLPHLEHAPGDPITVHELLTHTSGMPSDGTAGPLITRCLGIGHIEVPLSSEDDFCRHVQGSTDRRVTDRETFFYYNSGYTMLGKIVEAVSGREFASYVNAEILGPLGMTRSTFSREEFEADDDRMTPYVKQEGNSTESDFPFDPLIHAPGGLVSSAVEMANYVRMYMNDGSFDSVTILSTDSVDEMVTPESTFGSYIDGRDVEYGYGLMVQEFLGDTLIGHGGSITVSNAWFGYLEDAEIGVSIACTTTPEAHPMTVGPAILSILQDEDPEATVPYFKLVDALDAVTGEYRTYRDIGDATVERDGGTLKFTQEAGTGSQELHLTPETLEDDLLVCSTMTAAGMEYPVRFELAGDDIHFFFERSRFTKD